MVRLLALRKSKILRDSFNVMTLLGGAETDLEDYPTAFLPIHPGRRVIDQVLSAAAGR